MQRLGRLEIITIGPDTLNSMLDSVKVSFFHYPYPLLVEPTRYRKIRIASIIDIAAMKLVAIAQRGSKKDFVDLYAITQNGFNLAALFDALGRKFSDTAYNKMHILKSLSYFADAEEETMPATRIPYEWEKIKKELRSLCARYVQSLDRL